MVSGWWSGQFPISLADVPFPNSLLPSTWTCDLSMFPAGVTNFPMRTIAAICLLVVVSWPSDGVSQTCMRQPRSGHPNSRSHLYKNPKYGFTFLLPATWKGCKILEDRWSGYTDVGRGQEKVEGGPQIRIVNPRYQYRDIYIMIFTNKQWKSLQEGKFFVSAASIDPGELDRNTKYVFVEPPRMINPDVEGADEIYEIMKRRPLHAF